MQSQSTGQNKSVYEMQHSRSASPAIYHNQVPMPQSPAIVSVQSYNTATPTRPNYVKQVQAQPRDDLDVMLLHEDFPRLLSLAVEVKKYRQAIEHHCHNLEDSFVKPHSNSVLKPQEVIKAVERLQAQLVARPIQHKIARGNYPITDSIMDESMTTLQQELEICHQFVQNLTGTSGTEQSKTSTIITNNVESNKDNNSNRKEAILVKYSKQQTDILMNWMIENCDEPFPSQDDIVILMGKTGLTHSQVVNWTTNVRKRSRKATCEGGKKPHHFIDFLFLKKDRENKKRRCRKVPKSSHDTSKHVMAPRLPQLDVGHYHHTALPSPSFQPNQAPPVYNELEIDMMMNLEPLDVSDIGEHELLDDFADFWLNDDVVDDDLQPATVDEFTETQALTSMTNDSQTEDFPSRSRRLSVDLKFDGDNEDINSWAAELGLTIEV